MKLQCLFSIYYISQLTCGLSLGPLENYPTLLVESSEVISEGCTEVWGRNFHLARLTPN